MSFVNQVTTDSFVNQKIKVLKVLCTECLQEEGFITIPSPAGLTFDPLTGLLNAPVTLEPLGPPQIRTIEVLVGKVINMGVVPVRLLVNNCIICPLLEIPFQSAVDCPGAVPDGTINVQKHDIQVEGLIFSPIRLLHKSDCTLKLHLILKAVVKLCIVISREEILKVEAASQFCPCP